MMKRFVILISVVSVMFLAGCQNEYFSKRSYFDDAVIVEYKQSRSRENDDYLTFRFYEKGAYQISFSITPGKGGRGQKDIPKNFTEVVKKAPRESMVRQYVLPDFLRITITRSGVTEINDFS